MSKISKSVGKMWQALPFTSAPKPVVSHLSLEGVIASDSRTGRNLNMKRVEKALKGTFDQNGLKAVALSINSPGGSPVQSRLIHDRIRELAAEKEVPVLTFIEDVGASGGYILSMAGDEIFADDSSIVGSIGVIAGGFGFVDAIEKLGVERRVYTAGTNKSQLDSFKPENKEDVARFKQLLNHTHDVFINLVKERRKDKLAEDKSDEIFSGQFWAAAHAKELGLIDGIGHFRRVLKDRFGEDVKIKEFSIDERGLVAKLLAKHTLPTSLIDPDALIEAAETRSIWSRYGL